MSNRRVAKVHRLQKWLRMGGYDTPMPERRRNRRRLRRVKRAALRNALRAQTGIVPIQRMPAETINGLLWTVIRVPAGVILPDLIH